MPRRIEDHGGGARWGVINTTPPTLLFPVENGVFVMGFG